MTKYYEVGEIVRNISNGCYNEGDELIILKDDRGDSIPLLCHRIYDGREDWVRRSHVERVNPDTSARLSEAEAKIATLEAEVKALKDANKPKEYGGINLRHEIAKSPNQRRADVIKRAQAFVADLGKRAAHVPASGGNLTFNAKVTELIFHVNVEKGVVTALAKGVHSGKLWDKAFAKCAPGDVFNADIGKAIAAGRLYGVKVPAEFFDAPRPTEFAKGQRVYGTIPGCEYEVTKIDGRMVHTNPGSFFWASEFNTVNVLEDTDAVYS